MILFISWKLSISLETKNCYKCSIKLMIRYLDCPLGADEVGCFECDQHSYSCFNNNDEYQRAKLSSGGVMCYTLVQKCDGFSDCITGKDEEECSMLINQVGLHTVNLREKSYFGLPYILEKQLTAFIFFFCSTPMTTTTTLL